MKRHILVSISALCAIAACTLASCGRIEEAPTNEPETIEEPAAPQIAFTATLAAKGEDPQSKAITPGTEGGKEVLNVAWAEGEQIAVRYQTGATTYATTTATVGTPNGDGSAPITATLTSPMDGGSVTFVYPASLANTACDDIDESKLLNQHGNLTKRTTPNASVDDISTNFDAATGSGTISVTAGTAVVSSKVTMNNRVCICKFRFTLDDGSGMGGTVQQAFDNLKIYDGNGHVYTITSDRPDTSPSSIGGTRRFTDTDDIYVAMLPVSGKPVIFHYEQTVVGGKANYIKYSPNTALAAGKFYRSLNLTLTKDDYNGVYAFKDLSAGSITTASGDYIYQSNSAATANTITITDGATVTLAGVNISATGSAGITCSGSANIILEGTNIVTTSANNYPGILAGGSTTTLTISGSGSLTATGGADAAGIGSGRDGTCGNITISGGTVTATGNYSGAGIGTGFDGTCGNILISGGSIDAYGGTNSGAGIGCGTGGTCGTITITTGVTRVHADSSGYEYCIGKGINSANKTSTCGTITIGGTVYYDGTNFLNNGDTYLATSPLEYQP